MSVQVHRRNHKAEELEVEQLYDSCDLTIPRMRKEHSGATTVLQEVPYFLQVLQFRLVLCALKVQSTPIPNHSVGGLTWEPVMFG